MDSSIAPRPSEDGQRRRRDPLLFDIAVQILGIVIEETKAEGDLFVAALLLSKDYNDVLLPSIYRRVRLSSPTRLTQFNHTVTTNRQLASMVEALCLNFSDAPLLYTDFPCMIAYPREIPSVLAAVAPFLRVLVISVNVHPDILSALRTNVFPVLHTLEAPHYALMDADSTIRLHSRLRQCLRGSDTPPTGRRNRLTLASIVRSWPALRRLCIQCMWGAPDADGSPFDFRHLDTVAHVAVSLSGGEWESNVQYFLRRILPPSRASVVALLRPEGMYAHHSLYASLSFHPRLFVPVFGDPARFRYVGPAELEHLCNLTHVILQRPSDERFWAEAEQFLSTRDLLRRVFHGEQGTLVQM
ncbi:hypothetical protein VNI00_016640 [Paramarasmius palmivorus]|uniref:Uncharacterized protein n=1 Tax=Paramarasmius palmivorus TaxID=297713 RepID=A0AAW0BCN1_9AGAR